jgi:phytoene desaturase
MYRNVDRLEEHLIETSPQDEPLIRETCKAIRALGKLDMPIDKPMDMYSTLDNFKMIAKMLPFMSLMKKYNSITIEDFAEKFKHSLLRDAFKQSYPKQLAAILLLMIFSSLNSGDSGIPLGGSKKFAERIAKRYTSLGGKIHYNTKVNKIRVVAGKAEGIILVDGTERSGDFVVSAADGNFTLTHMLEGKYMDDKLQTLFSDRETYITFPSVNVFVGIDCDLSNEPHGLFFKPSHKVDAGGVSHEWLGLTIYSYDKSFAPLGKSVVAASFLAADYDWWKQKYQDKKAYKAEK